MIGLILAAALAVPSYSCGTRQVSPGARKLELIGACGEPALADRRVEGDVTVDEWSYNFGPYQPIAIFRFEDGVLRSIELGDYGF